MATATVPMMWTTPDTSGNATIVALSSSTYQEYPALTSTTADGRWHWLGYVPDNYASSPSLIVVYCANATSGVFRVNTEFATAKDAEDQDQTLTASTAQEITVPGTAYLQDRVTFTANIPTLEPGDILYGAVHRDGDHANDTLAVPALLVAVLLSYTTT